MNSSYFYSAPALPGNDVLCPLMSLSPALLTFLSPPGITLGQSIPAVNDILYLSCTCPQSFLITTVRKYKAKSDLLKESPGHWGGRSGPLGSCTFPEPARGTGNAPGGSGVCRGRWMGAGLGQGGSRAACRASHGVLCSLWGCGTDESLKEQTRAVPRLESG